MKSIKHSFWKGLDHVRFLHSDWFSALADETFDLIISNPPYVEDDSPYLREGDVRFEPASALTSGSDGLNDIRFIATNAKSHLARGGYLMFEHGFEQGPAVRQIMSEHQLKNVNTVEDLSQLPRCTFGRDSN